LFAGLGITVLVVTVTPVVPWYARTMAGRWNDPKGEVLIVLGGSSIEDGTLGRNSYLRAQYAVRAYRQGGFRKVLISGGGSPRPVALSMAEFLQFQGIPKDAILVETLSANTRENALYSKPMLDALPGRKVLLTSDYHVFRATRAFRKLGADVVPRPFPDAIKEGQTWRGRWPAFIEVVLESGKIAYYYSRAWI
jgi:uncharacterized SAM-binding protein YcdF (DUF218 family)